MTHPFSHAVDAYVKQLQKAFAQGDATEHTHRPALQLLLEASAANIKATNEPKAAERENKPDYIVRRGSSIIGFVEAKDIDADLEKALKTPQLKRYVEALPNLLLTNYTDFIWFVGGQKRMEISVATVYGKAITPAPALYTTAVTEAEIRVGVSMMPTGKRKAQLQATVDQTFAQIFAGRILQFDSAAAVVYAEISASRRSIGRPISPFDAQVAAIARANRAAAIATRNVDDFASVGVDIVNPRKQDQLP